MNDVLMQVFTCFNSTGQGIKPDTTQRLRIHAGSSRLDITYKDGVFRLVAQDSITIQPNVSNDIELRISSRA